MSDPTAAMPTPNLLQDVPFDAEMKECGFCASKANCRPYYKFPEIDISNPIPLSPSMMSKLHTPQTAWMCFRCSEYETERQGWAPLLYTTNGSKAEYTAQKLCPFEITELFPNCDPLGRRAFLSKQPTAI